MTRSAGEVYVFNHRGKLSHGDRCEDGEGGCDDCARRKSGVRSGRFERQVAFTATSRTRAKSRRSIRRSTKWSRAGRSRREKNRPASRLTRRIIGCSSPCHNKMMEMLDTETGKVLATVPIGIGRRRLRVRRGFAAGLRVVRRRSDDDREGGIRRTNSSVAQTLTTRARRAHDRARSANASDLFADG